MFGRTENRKREILDGLTAAGYQVLPDVIDLDSMSVVWQRGSRGMTLHVFVHEGTWKIAYIDSPGNRLVLEPEVVMNEVATLEACHRKFDNLYGCKERRQSPEVQS